jgi:hypothetical protein
MTGFSVLVVMSITDGMIATTQVVTNGGPNGGLYNCADITFPALLLELIVLFAGMGPALRLRLRQVPDRRMRLLRRLFPRDHLRRRHCWSGCQCWHSRIGSCCWSGDCYGVLAVTVALKIACGGYGMKRIKIKKLYTC